MLFATGCAKLRRCSNTHSRVSLESSYFHGPIATQVQESVVFFAFPKSRANGKLKKHVVFHNPLRKLCLFCRVSDSFKNNDYDWKYKLDAICRDSACSKRGPRVQIGFSAPYKHWAKPCQTRLPRNTDHEYKSGFPLFINTEPNHAKPDCPETRTTSTNRVFRSL